MTKKLGDYSMKKNLEQNNTIFVFESMLKSMLNKN